MPRVSVVLGGAAVLHREAEKRGVKLCTTTGYPPQAWWEMGRFWATNIGVWIDGGVDSPCHIKWPVGMVSPNHRCSILHFVFSHAKPSFRMCFFVSLKTNFRKNRGYQCIIFITATRRTHSQRPQDRLRGLLSNGADRASRAFASLRQKAKSLDPRDEKWKRDLQQMTSGFLLKGLFTSLTNFPLVMKTKGVSPVICSGLHKQICAGSGYWRVSELEAMKHFSKNCMSISTFRLLRSFPEKFWIAMRRSAKGWFIAPLGLLVLGTSFFQEPFEKWGFAISLWEQKVPWSIKKRPCMHTPCQEGLSVGSQGLRMFLRVVGV